MLNIPIDIVRPKPIRIRIKDYRFLKTLFLISKTSVALDSAPNFKTLLNSKLKSKIN